MGGQRGALRMWPPRRAASRRPLCGRKKRRFQSRPRRPVGRAHGPPAWISQAGVVILAVRDDAIRPLADALAQARAIHGEQVRSEEHTSELQSPCNLVCRLLLEKKKKKRRQTSRSIMTRIMG